jgi:nitroreductase
MELTDAIRRRRMVRAYDPDRPVPPEALDLLLHNAIRAPSAGFSQGWDFLVMHEQGDRDLFWATTTEPGDPDSWLRDMQSAPLLIACLSDKDAYLDRYAEADKGWTDRDEARWPVPYWDVDTGMAAMLMLLSAVDQGLGACFFGIPPTRHEDFRTAFDVPANRTPVGVVSVGYAAPDRRSPSLRRGRRGLDEVVHVSRFGTPYTGPGSA